MIKNLALQLCALALVPSAWALAGKDLPPYRHEMPQLLALTVTDRGQPRFQDLYLDLLRNFTSNPETAEQLQGWLANESALPRPLPLAIPDLIDLIAKLYPQKLFYSEEKVLPELSNAKFVWGFGVDKLNLANSVSIHFSGFLENSATPHSLPVAAHSSSQLPHTKHIKSNDFDVALHINQGVFNRALQLAFESRLLNTFKVGAQNATLLYQPVLRAPVHADSGKYGQSPALKIRLKIAMNISGMFQRALVRDPATLDIDIDARMSISADAKKLSLTATRIDTDSLLIDESSYTFIGRAFRSNIIEKVKQELDVVNVRWQATPQTLPVELPIPTEILGDQLAVKGLIFDPKGYLSLYLTL